MNDKLPQLVRIVDALIHQQYHFLKEKAKEPERIAEIVESQLYNYELHSERMLYANDFSATDAAAYMFGP